MGTEDNSAQTILHFKYKKSKRRFLNMPSFFSLHKKLRKNHSTKWLFIK